jgi:hypothetical protein
MRTYAVLACAAVTAFFVTTANAGTIDTIDATSGQANTFFVPAPGQELDSPYYRGDPDSAGTTRGADWGWSHNPVTGFTTATLSISAYDVDYSSGERDAVYLGSSTGPGSVFLGFLQGSDNSFSFTSFDVSSYVSILNAGAGVWLAINTGNTIDPTGSTGWIVSLAKSVITTDGTDPGNPNPGTSPTPLPGAAFLMGTVLASGAGFGAWRRRRKA